MSLRLGTDAANSAANAVAGRLNGGSVRIYNGNRPGSGADGAVTTQTLLAEAPLGNPAFGAASGGEITATTITQVTVIASSTQDNPATWFRVLRSDGVTVEFDGTVGTSNADCLVSSTIFVINQPLQITALTFQFPLS